MPRILYYIALILVFFPNPLFGKNTLPLNDFISKATKQDTVFEEILLDTLVLKYRKASLMPVDDLIVDVKSQYNLNLGQASNSPEFSLALDKLFINTGTSANISYQLSEDFNSNKVTSLSASISQPIARNAFGKDHRLLSRLLDVENDMMHYQIIEAYEDYFASLISAYHSWYSAYESLNISKSAYQSSLRLLENMQKRRRQKIALDVDVNKIKLLVANKKETIAIRSQQYEDIKETIFTAIRSSSKENYTPTLPTEFLDIQINFQKDYTVFINKSRTHAILKLLDQQGDLEVKRSADKLLPSTDLLLGYSNTDLSTSTTESLYAGISVNWNIRNKTNKNQLAIDKINSRRIRLQNTNRGIELKSDLIQLHQKIKRESRLLELAKEKNQLSRAIFREEEQNYSYGKISLNDYIDAVNRLDENRFNQILHSVQLNLLHIEWLRLTDQLVDKNKISLP